MFPKDFGVKFLKKILEFLSIFAEVGAENPPPEVKEEIDVCAKCSHLEACECACVNRRQVQDWEGWEKIPTRYSVSLAELYKFLTPPVCGGPACRYNFDEKWNSMANGFYSLLRKSLPATLQTSESIAALRAVFLDLTSGKIFLVDPQQQQQQQHKITNRKSEHKPQSNNPSILSRVLELEGGDEEEGGDEDGNVRLEEPDDETKTAAATGIQKSMKGFLTRKIVGARLFGSAGFKKAAEALVKLVKALEPKVEDLGPLFLREMFKTRGNLFKCFLFSRNDEKHTLPYGDFHGVSTSAPNHDSRKWTARFRFVCVREGHNTNRDRKNLWGGGHWANTIFGI